MKNKQITNVVYDVCASAFVVASCTLSLVLPKTFGILCGVFGAMLSLVFVVLSFLLKLKLFKELELQKQNDQKKAKETASLLDVYAILGIPPQYKSDGSLKDVYELLGIKPQYSSDGKRINTIYEQLGINPRFTQGGTEIPFVLRVKNRVNSLVKLQKTTAPLIYFPRDKQIIGDKHILPQPVTAEKKEPLPDIKQTKVIKPAAKPAAKKPETTKYGSKFTDLKGSAVAAYAPKVTITELGKKIDIKVETPKDDKTKTQQEVLFNPGELLKKAGEVGKQVVKGVVEAGKEVVEGVSAIVNTVAKVGTAPFAVVDKIVNPQNDNIEKITTVPKQAPFGSKKINKQGKRLNFGDGIYSDAAGYEPENQ